MKAPLLRLPMPTSAVTTMEPASACFAGQHNQGARLLLVAKPAEKAKLVTYSRDGTSFRVDVDYGGTIRQLHIKHIDHPELTCLRDCDRATLQGALATIHRDASNAP
jgi:hypothetical protein